MLKFNLNTSTNSFPVRDFLSRISSNITPEPANNLKAESAACDWDDLWPTLGEANLRNAHTPVRFEIVRRSGQWLILRDGRTCGGHVSRAGALKAANSAIHDVFCSGASAELVAVSPEPSALMCGQLMKVPAA